MAKVIGFRCESASADLSIWGDGTATVNRLYSKTRGMGHATRLMQDICDYADLIELTIVLIAWPFGNPRGRKDAHELVSFYEKFGFEGGTYDVGIGTFMTRQPAVKMVVQNP